MATQRKQRAVERTFWCLLCTPKVTSDAAPVSDNVADLLQHFDDAHPALNVRQAIQDKQVVGERKDAMFLDGARGTYRNTYTDDFSLPDGTPVLSRLTIDGNM